MKKKDWILKPWQFLESLGGMMNAIEAIDRQLARLTELRAASIGYGDGVNSTDRRELDALIKPLQEKLMELAKELK